MWARASGSCWWAGCDQVRDPAALPGWIVTTTRRECGRLLRATTGPHAASSAADVDVMADKRAGTIEDDVLAAERHAVLLEAMAGLPPPAGS